MDGPLKINQANLEEVQRKIGIRFRNPELLLSALTHRSWCNENKGEGIEHNERLEFLGDAVLEYAVTTYLYKAFRQAQEGRLTQIRSALVRTLHLAAVGMELGLDKYLRMSRGDARDRQSNPEGFAARRILGSAFEALVGAISIDRGWSVAELFVHEFLLPKLQELLKREFRHPKELLQNLSQEHGGTAPVYNVLSESGPMHHRKYVVAALIKGNRVAFGEGSSKHEAETNAAIRVLAERYNITNLVDFL
ncbi:MAG: ribonuclease III [Patescibacteria group bacterium]